MFPSENSELKAGNISVSDGDLGPSVDVTQLGVSEPIKILLFPPKNRQFRFDEHTNKIEIEPLHAEGSSEKLSNNETTLTPLVERCNIFNSTPTAESTPVKNAENETNQELQIDKILQIKKPFQDSKLEDECFLKGCKWSGDGLCLLTNSEDYTLRLFEFNNNLISEPRDDIEPVLQMKEGGIIYDYVWYPKMSSCDPVSCVFASTSQNSPIHLWDAYTGQLRATYQPINQYDEVTSAYSLAFTPDGSKIYAGFKKCLRIFNISFPGRIFEERKLRTRGNPFQSNILSSICINPMIPSLYVLGSYDKTIGVYAEPEGELLCILKGHCGGITQVLFSADGHYLFSGARKDDEILCWDMRNPGKVVFSVERKVDTQQRILFDLSHDQNYLITGRLRTTLVSTFWLKDDLSWGTVVIPVHRPEYYQGREPWREVFGTTDCNIKIFNIKSQNEKILKPISCFKGHEDCVNGVQFHPSLNVFASSSGQRHLPQPSDEEENDSNSILGLQTDNSIIIWSYS